jgi:hypothetical protein
VSAAVVLHGPSDVPTPTWKPISNLVSFAGAVWSTAQNYHDNTQSMLPSYRERIVQICFARSEGGLNLAMEPRTIERIKRKGRAAGELLCSQFDFDRHRWVRLLVLLAQLEVRLSEMRSAVPSVNEYVALLEKQRTADPKFPYSRPASPWCEEALARLRQLTDLIDRWHEADEVWQRQHPGKPLFPYRSPAPPPVLRITPEL